MTRPPLDLTKRFLILLALMIFITAFMTQMFYGRQERTNLETRLREKASFINNFYAFLIADSLVRKDDVTLLQVVNRLEEDREISSVIVVDQSLMIRYHVDPQKVGIATKDTLIINSLKNNEAMMTNFQNEGGRALALVTPLKAQGLAKPLGAVRIDLTYRQLNAQINSSRKRFWMLVFLGCLVTCSGLFLVYLNRWVVQPLEKLRAALASTNPAAPDASLQPLFNDDVGHTYAAVNDLLLRFKTELQQQSSQHVSRGDQEKIWVKQLVGSFLPGARVIAADKDNRVVMDSDNGASNKTERRHLLDLIKDAHFANLVTSAFQKEGEVVQGPVTFQDKVCNASVLCVPPRQSVLIKTLIALQPKGDTL